MKEPILIKGNKHGISIILDEKVEFDEIKSKFASKLYDSKKFFGNAKVTVTIEGRKISEIENQELLKVIEENSDLDVICLIDEDFNENLENKPETISQSLEGLTILENDIINDVSNENMSCFHKGTLRSGQEIISDSSVIIIGNVNDGAKVISKGNIVVIGKLSGFVEAGSDGDNKAFVVALHMNPSQIKIGTRLARSDESNQERIKINSYNPQIAFIEGNRIVIEDITNSTYENLSF